MKIGTLAAAAVIASCAWCGAETVSAAHPMFDQVQQRYEQNITWQQMKTQVLSKDKKYLVEQNGRWGVLDSSGRTILPVAYEKITVTGGQYLLLKQDGCMGVSDFNGGTVVPVFYEKVHRLPEGFWLVRYKDGWGALTADGMIAVPCIYDKIRPVGGRFFVERQDKWGVIGEDGANIWPCTYEEIRDDGRGGYIVKEADGFRYYTAEGQLLHDGSFQQAGKFSEGLAAVRTKTGCAYLNTGGQLQLENAYDKARAFHEGLALVEQGGERFFIDTQGSRVCAAPDGKYIRGFQEGLAVFKHEGAFHFINMLGQEEFSFKAAAFKKLENGMYRITRTRHNISLGGLLQSAVTMVAGIPTIPGVGKSFYDTVLKRGYTDSQGRILISTENDFNSLIIDDKVLALVNDKPAYYDLSGGYLLPPAYEDAGELDLDTGKISVVDTGSGSGFYLLGQGLVKDGYYDADNFVNHLAPVKITPSRWTYIDENFQQAVRGYFQQATPFYGNFAIVQDNKGRYCIIDKSGEVRALLKANTEEISPLQPESAIVKASGKYGVINSQGRYFIAPEYDKVQYLQPKNTQN